MPSLLSRKFVRRGILPTFLVANLLLASGVEASSPDSITLTSPAQGDGYVTSLCLKPASSRSFLLNGLGGDVWNGSSAGMGTVFASASSTMS